MEKLIIPILVLLASCGTERKDVPTVLVDTPMLHPRDAYINTLKSGDTIDIQYGTSIKKVRVDCIYREERKVKYTLIGYSISDISGYDAHTLENIHLLNQPCK